MSTKAEYSASLIAKYFIWKAGKEGKKVSNKKLQKLLYYAQAWNLVFNDKPLFKEDIEAWIHGPAVWSVYQEYKDLGFKDIDEKVEESDVKDIKEKELLDTVWSIYGKFDAQYLETLSHNEKPWQVARESVGSNISSRNAISLDLMKEYYTSVLAKAKNG